MLGRMLSGRPQGQATTTTKQSAEPLAMEARHVAEQLSNALNRTDAPFALDDRVWDWRLVVCALLVVPAARALNIFPLSGVANLCRPKAARVTAAILSSMLQYCCISCSAAPGWAIPSSFIADGDAAH